MIRTMNNGYQDGISELNQNAYPGSARSDSLSANDAKGVNDAKVPEVNSDMSTTTGQIMTHEFMRSMKCQTDSRGGGPGMACCNNRNDPLLAESLKNNKYCTCIDVKGGDTCYGNSVPGLPFVKTIKTLHNCRTDELPCILNGNTAFIDAELVYTPDALEYLKNNNGTFDVSKFPDMKKILVDYDERSQQLPGLFLYLNFFIKLHNIVFNELRKSSKGTLTWQQRCFEAQKFVTAIYQKNYMEYLSTILRKLNCN